MTAWTYILLCADGSYYAGWTSKLEVRWAQHQAGTHDGYTATRRPLDLVWVGAFQSIYDAIDMERRIKRWSRAKKDALIRRDHDAPPGLSKRGFRPALAIHKARHPEARP